MKILAALVAAAASTLVAGGQALADPMPPRPFSTTCVNVGATWVGGQQVVEPTTVCLPTP
jgi:hypothetical protein